MFTIIGPINYGPPVLERYRLPGMWSQNYERYWSGSIAVFITTVILYTGIIHLVPGNK